MSNRERASATVVVENITGLHARPASTFVRKAARYKSDIYIVKNGTEINAKSIMGVLSAGISQGSEVCLEAEGVDAQEAIDALVELFENKFGEAE